MALEITVGPPQLTINEGNVVLVTDPDGQIVFPSDKRRLFFRYASDHNGVPWDLLNSGNITHYASRIFLTNGAIPTEDGEIPPKPCWAGTVTGGERIGAGVQVAKGSRGGARLPRSSGP
jgi:hypothetical protein